MLVKEVLVEEVLIEEVPADEVPADEVLANIPLQQATALILASDVPPPPPPSVMLQLATPQTSQEEVSLVPISLLQVPTSSASTHPDVVGSDQPQTASCKSPKSWSRLTSVAIAATTISSPSLQIPISLTFCTIQTSI